MKLLLAILLATIPSESRMKKAPSETIPVTREAPAIVAPLGTTGALIPEDAGTVAHVYWSPNILLYSNDFTQAAWSTYGTGVPTITYGLPDPTGGNAASRISFPGGAVASEKYQYLSASAPYSASSTYVASIWLKKISGTATTVPLRMYAAAPGNAYFATLNVPLTTSWARYEVSGAPSVTAPIAFVLGSDSNGVPQQADVVVDAFNAQMEYGSAASPSSSTTTVANPLKDTKGNAWAMNGTVPPVTISPLFPYGSTGPTKPGAGPFSGVNYYSLGTGADVLDFAGDFTLCFVYLPGALNPNLFRNNPSDFSAVSGYQVYLGSSSNQVAIGFGAGAAFNVLVTSSAPSMLNVTCAGRVGTTGYIKSNLAVTSSGAVGAPVPATASPALLGLGGDVMYEVYATSTPWSEANVVQIQKRVLGLSTPEGDVSLTRAAFATSATYQPIYSGGAGTIYYATNNMPRIGQYGLLIEPARDNWVFFSGTMTTGAAPTFPWQVSAGAIVSTGAAGGFLDGVGAWSTMTSVVNTDAIFQTPLTTPASSTFVGSAWVMAAAPGLATVIPTCNAGNNALACSCITSDGRAATALAVGTNCRCTVATTTTPVRVSALLTCTAATTAPAIYISPGQYGVTVGTATMSGAQLELGAYPTTYMPTTSTSGTRNADTVTTPSLLTAGDNKWCATGTYTVGENAPWASDYRGLWVFGTISAAGSARSYVNATNALLSAYSYDAAAAFRASTNATPFAGSGTTHTATICADGSRDWSSMTVDSTTETTLGLSGVGLGPPLGSGTPVQLGTEGQLFYLGGYVKNFKLCRTSNPAECK